MSPAEDCQDCWMGTSELGGPVTTDRSHSKIGNVRENLLHSALKRDHSLRLYYQKSCIASLVLGLNCTFDKSPLLILLIESKILNQVDLFIAHLCL